MIWLQLFFVLELAIGFFFREFCIDKLLVTTGRVAHGSYQKSLLDGLVNVISPKIADKSIRIINSMTITEFLSSNIA